MFNKWTRYIKLGLVLFHWSQIQISTCFLTAVCYRPWLNHKGGVSKWISVCYWSRETHQCYCGTRQIGFKCSSTCVLIGSQDLAFLVASGLILTLTQWESNLTKVGLFATQRKNTRKKSKSKEGAPEQNGAQWDNPDRKSCVALLTVMHLPCQKLRMLLKWCLRIWCSYLLFFSLTTISRAPEGHHQPPES